MMIFPKGCGGLVFKRDEHGSIKCAEKSAFQFIITPRNRWGKEKELAVFSRLLDTAVGYWPLAVNHWLLVFSRPTANG